MAKWDLSKMALQEISDIGQDMERQREREEAIVRAALERAANKLNQEALYWSGLREGVLFDREVNKIRALASDPAEVAAILKKAGRLNNERSEEEDRG
jgi:hypothetical protein